MGKAIRNFVLEIAALGTVFVLLLLFDPQIFFNDAILGALIFMVLAIPAGFILGWLVSTFNVTDEQRKMLIEHVTLPLTFAFFSLLSIIGGGIGFHAFKALKELTPGKETENKKRKEDLQKKTSFFSNIFASSLGVKGLSFGEQVLSLLGAVLVASTTIIFYIFSNSDLQNTVQSNMFGALALPVLFSFVGFYYALGYFLREQKTQQGLSDFQKLLLFAVAVTLIPFLLIMALLFIV